MNKEAIQKVINAIKRSKPERVVMNSILTEYVIDDKGRHISNCGTAGCIAGWTLIAHKMDNNDQIGNFNTAAKILDIDRVEYYQLFMMDKLDGRPIMNLGDFDRDYTAKQRKKMVIRVLELLRDTGKVQWERVIKEQENADRSR